jgi:hypothetical protein
MESINVVIDDAEVGSLSKGERTLSFLEELPTPLVNMVKPSSSTQETSVIPLATAPPPDPLEIVPSKDTASASKYEVEPTNPLKRSWVKLNHPSRQLIGNLDEGRRLRNRVIQRSNEVANQVTYSYYLAQVEQKKVDEGCISLLETMCGLLFPDLQITMSLVPSGSSRTNQMSMVQSSETRLVSLLKVILRLKG